MIKDKPIIKKRDSKIKKFIANGGRNNAERDFYLVLKRITNK
ncbi:hypothetical protein LBMAG33_2960 [Candidatus Levyibacteriota bacterium]|nr:hypothetical protein [Candidatus Levybacteria bacterium]GDX61986.1 hypothetical protein LBMAG33_2960 [Candidatus Levybacteria bacterium]